MSFATGLQVANLTDVGMRRTTNQDSLALLIADSAELFRDRGHLLMVADGMGAHAAGELASKLAADGVPHLYHKYRDVPAAEALLRAVRETNAEIHRRGTANADFHNMGTTASILAILPQGAMAAHVGDSRIYRLRGQTLEQLTFDHSLQWELRASGQVPEGSEFASSIPKNVITRSLGPNANVQVDMEGPHPILPGDTFLLCSDGLTGRVEDIELGAILACLSPQDAVRALVDLANLRGGPDNSTVIIARVVGHEAATGSVGTQPLWLDTGSSPQPVHPALWIAAGAALVIAGILAALTYWLPAAISLGVAILALVIALVQRYGGGGAGGAGGGAMLGRGPYTRVECPPNHQLVDKLAATLAELREAAHDGSWAIDWGPIDSLCTKAAAADQAGNHAEAIRGYCQGITYTMEQLRKQPPKKGSDSAIEY